MVKMDILWRMNSKDATVNVMKYLFISLFSSASLTVVVTVTATVAATSVEFAANENYQSTCRSLRNDCNDSQTIRNHNSFHNSL